MSSQTGTPRDGIPDGGVSGTSGGGTAGGGASAGRGKERNIYLLGGTSFARRLVTGLEEAGHPVRLSVATFLGAEAMGEEPKGGVQVGRLGVRELTAELQEWAAEVLVDAGHPYARELRDTAECAAECAGVPLIRACRRPWQPETEAETDHVRFFKHERELTTELTRSGARALFTVGAKALAPFAGTGVVGGARVLPTAASVAAAQECGLTAAEIIAAYPPYSAEFTAGCMRHLECSVLVSKESGNEGGLDAKLEAVRQMGGELLILSKPEERRKPAFTLEQVIAQLEGV